MHLAHVHIERFRGIGSLSLDLDPVTAVIGENNHGKTSVFDVLGLFFGTGGSLRDRKLRWDDFHQPDPDRPPGDVRVAFTFEHVGDLPDTAYRAAITDDRDGRRRLRVVFSANATERIVRSDFVDARGRPVEGLKVDSTVDALRADHPLFLLRFAQPSPRATGPDSPPESADASAGDREPTRDNRGRRGLEVQIARVYREISQTRGPVPNDHVAGGMEAARQLVRQLRAKGDGPGRPMSRMLDQLLADPVHTRVHEAGRSRQERAGSGSHTLGLLMVIGALLDGRGQEILPEGATPIIAIEEPEVHLHPILLASTWDVIETLAAQTVVSTNSGELLSSMPLERLRRLHRRGSDISVGRLDPGSLDPKEHRRVGYHIGAKRGSVLFARCWLFVEGETEFWVLRQLASTLGYDLEAEGVRIVEFAQCGVKPLAKLANDLGIEWHLLSDGDHSGGRYVEDAKEVLAGAAARLRITRLDEKDLERCFWEHGFQDVYLQAARWRTRPDDDRDPPAARVIAKAVKNTSKPYLALSAAEAVDERGPDSVPPQLAAAIRTSVELARDAAL